MGGGADVMKQDFNLFGEVVAHRRVADFYLMSGCRTTGSAMAEDVEFGVWLHHRPASALKIEIGLRAAMCNGKPYFHFGSNQLHYVNFASAANVDQWNALKLFERGGLPQGWLQTVGRQMLMSPDLDAMAKLRIAEKMA